MVSHIEIVAAAMGPLVLYAVYRFFRYCYKLLRHVKAFRRFERRLQYCLIWATRITWIGGVIIAFYLIANGAVLIYLRDKAERWAGIIAAANSIPLFLGGRRNPLIYFFGLNVHSITHCIIGLVAVTEGLLHAALTLYRARLSTSFWDYMAASAFLLLLLTSLSPVRPWLCRILGGTTWWVTHILFAIASLVGMAGYMKLLQPVVDTGLVGIVAIYISGTIWIGGIGARYLTRRRTLASVETEIDHLDSTEIIVRHELPLPVFPGCYFFVSHPRRFGFMSLQFNVFVNSQPLMFVGEPRLSDDSQRRNHTSFVMTHNRPGQRQVPLRIGQQVLLDGPYGLDIKAASCTTMVLAARGPGIVGVLSFACHQVDRFKDKSSQKEKLRVDILWVLDHVTQQDLVGNLLRQLQDLDPKSNTVVWLLYPPQTNKADVKPPFEVKQGYWAWFRADNYLAYLDKLMLDCPSENCIVIACGDQSFSAAVRATTAAKIKPAVRFAEVQFRPRMLKGYRTMDEETGVGVGLNTSLGLPQSKQTRAGSTALALRRKKGSLQWEPDLEEIELTPVRQPKARPA